MIFLVLAAIVNFAAFIWLVVVGFKRSVLWGLAIFFLSPIAAIIFAVTNWYSAKKPFLAYLLSSILFLIPYFMLANQYDEDFAERLAAKVESGEIPQNEVAKYIQDPSLLDELDRQQADEGDAAVLDQEGTPPGVTEGVDAADTTAKTDASGTTTGKPTESGQTPDTSATEEVIEENESEYPKPGQAKPDPLITKKKKAEPESVQVSIANIGKYKSRYFIVTTKNGTVHRGILVKVTSSRIILERKIYGGTFTYRILKKDIKRLEMLRKDYVDRMS